MKIFNRLLLLMLSTVLFVPVSFAADAEIKWEDVDSYSDIRPANEVKSRYHKRIFKELEQHFIELAETLPQGQSLSIVVTNLDLAGDVRFMVGPNNATVRVVSDLYFPKMKFDYQLLDETGKVLSTGHANIKDISFNTGHQSISPDPFHYEKNMITDWFNDEFSQQHAKL